jgi:hypothetical protein
LYQPDKFVVLKINHLKGGLGYRLFGSWGGGYLSGDSWKLNSGITKVEKVGPFLSFHGKSGSVYKVHEEMYGVTGYTGSVLESWRLQAEEGVVSSFEVLPYDTDWVNFDWTGGKHED